MSKQQDMKVLTPMDEISALEKELKPISSELVEDDISSEKLEEEMKVICQRGLLVAEMPVGSVK